MSPDLNELNPNIHPEDLIKKSKRIKKSRSGWNLKHTFLGILTSTALITSVGCEHFIPPPTSIVSSKDSPDILIPPYVLTDLSSYPSGKTKEVEDDLSTLQRVLRQYVNTSESDLGSKILSDNYSQTIDGIVFSNQGVIGKSDDGTSIGVPDRFDKAVKYNIVGPDIELYRRISIQSHRAVEDELRIWLNADGKISTGGAAFQRRGAILSNDDIKRDLKIFNLPDGSVQTIESEGDFTQNFPNAPVIHYYSVTKYYPDGTSISIFGASNGLFTFHINSAPPHSYIAP